MMNVMHQPVASGSLTLKEVEQTLKIIPAGFGSCHSFLYQNLAHAAAWVALRERKHMEMQKLNIS